MIENVIIMGAAGRDFHNFNIYFRGNPRYRVIAFTATQIPDIEGRRYPSELAGDGYPDGIPIYPEEDLRRLIRAHRIDLVAFSYSDISHANLMHKASRVMAEGADFILIGAAYTMLRSSKPIVSVCAVRTGCGKSPTTRRVIEILQNAGNRVVAVRHPMPYGDLRAQEVQRFGEYADFDRHHCTIEEREEYEPLVAQGIPVFAGIDYRKILTAAEEEADVIVWDGGNNDTPFFYPDVHIVLVDPHRAGHETAYFPGETNLLMAHIAIITKMDSAPPEGVSAVESNIRRLAPEADVLKADIRISLRPKTETGAETGTEKDPTADMIRDRRVLVVEDGPTLTHGEMAFGAGYLAAQRNGAGEIVDPRPYACGSIGAVFDAYPHIGPVLPAMGYGEQQIRDLQATLESADADLILYATPFDLPRLISLSKPVIRVVYEYADHESDEGDGSTGHAPDLASVLLDRLEICRNRKAVC